MNATDQSIDSVVQHLSNLLNHDSFESAENSLPKIMNTIIPLLTYLKIDYIGNHTPY